MPISNIDRIRQSKPAKIVRKLPEGVASWAPPGGSMVVSSPAEVDAILRRVPAGRVTTLDHVRAHLAERHATSIACPVSTAIFINVAARAAEEAAALGNQEITPYWRALRSDGSLNEKYPGGISRQRACLEAEGHSVVPRGKRWIVADYEKALATFD